MTKSLNKILIITLSIISVLLLALNVTLALMGDRKMNTGIIQFKEHKLDISIINNDSIILKPEELVVGAESTRTITIKNPATSTSCVLRIWLEFYVENNLDTSYLSLNLDEGKFSKSDSGKFYYKNVFNSKAEIENLILTFKVNNEISANNYKGKSYTLKLFVESIQSTKGAVDEWSLDYPAEWRTSIENKLN